MHKTSLLFLLQFYSIFCFSQTEECCNNFYNDSSNFRSSFYLLEKPIQFKSGDTIASIGAGCGWFELGCSVSHDSLVFYVEDIDSQCLNDSLFSYQKKQYERLKKAPIANNFKLILGNSDTTFLPKNKFDKIIMMSTFHHFQKKEKLLKEISTCLKFNGVLYVFEPIYKTKKHCYFPSKNKLFSFFKENEWVKLKTIKIVNGTFLATFRKK